MPESISLSTGIADRYAQAVFDLATEDGSTQALATDLDALDAALKQSADLRALIASPVYTREEMAQAIGAVAQKMGLSTTLRNTLALLADKRRLFVLPQMIAGLRAKLAEAAGEVTAEVVSAQPLSADQAKRLQDRLSAREGRNVKLDMTVDESLIGGLVVRLGSRMIDTSVKAKLGRLQTMMKEVG